MEIYVLDFCLLFILFWFSFLTLCSAFIEFKS